MNNMRAFRKMRGISQEQLARMVGLHVNTLIHIEKSIIPSTSITNFVRISRALGGSIEEVFWKEYPNELF